MNTSSVCLLEMAMFYFENKIPEFFNSENWDSFYFKNCNDGNAAY